MDDKNVLGSVEKNSEGAYVHTSRLNLKIAAVDFFKNGSFIMLMPNFRNDFLVKKKKNVNYFKNTLILRPKISFLLI